MFSLISRFAKQGFFWLGAALFTVFIGVLVKGFQGHDAEKFTQGLVTVGGIAVAIAGLGYVLAQSLERQPRAWINRESGNMFAGALMWFYAAFAQFIFAALESGSPLLNYLYGGIVGLFALLASVYTLFSASYLLDFLNKPSSIERLETGPHQHNRFMRRIYRFLNRPWTTK